MTNEEKERLKENVTRAFNFYIVTRSVQWATDILKRDKETILSLLDRVPSEEQAKGTQVYISIDSNGKPNRKRTYCGKCGLCVKNQKYCQDCGAKLIWPAVVYNRKALGIKGKG